MASYLNKTKSMSSSKKVTFWAFTVALGGFLFGFDTAVISGAEQDIQQLWRLSDGMIGQLVAMALYGTVIGALFGGVPAEHFGRKRSLFWIGLLYLLSAVGSALAPDANTLMLFRFIGGLGVGASSVVAPMYISEIAPAGQRGRLVATFQFNIVLGIMVAYLSNWFIAGSAFDSWRVMLGVETLPALAFVLMVLGVPRSPRWLVVKRGEEAEALSVLEQINPEVAAEQLAANSAITSRVYWRGNQGLCFRQVQLADITCFPLCVLQSGIRHQCCHLLRPTNI